MIHIRPATSADIPGIQAVGTAAWHDTYTGLVPEGYVEVGLERMWTAETFARSLTNDRERLLVAEQDGSVVGMLQLACSDTGIAWLWRLYVLRAVRGQGVGRRLWEAAVASLPAGVRTYRTSVVRGNPALRFYKRLGFTVLYDADPDFFGFQVPLTYMECPAAGDAPALPPTDPALIQIDYATSELNYNALMTPAYHSALAALNLPTGSRGLDLGCGPGGLLPLLDTVTGGAGQIHAVDISHPHLAAARSLCAAQDIADRVRFEWVDLARPLPFADAVFDWVWSADVLWPGRSFDPLAAVREAARITRPGGLVALFFLAGRRGIFLPGEPVLDVALRLARDSALYPRAPTPLHPETASRWLRAAGLTEVQTSAHTVLARPPFDPAVRGYLEGYLMTELRQVPREAVPEMTADDWARWQRLCNPDSPEYLFNDPDYYCLQLATLAVGVVPQSAAAFHPEAFE